MRLWTWQSKGFSLANKSRRVEPLKYSWYANENVTAEEAQRHEEAYLKVFGEFGTDKLLWCFTHRGEATCEGSRIEFEQIQGRLLWELDVPEDKIRWYCPVAWEKLRSGKQEMKGAIGGVCQALERRNSKRSAQFKGDFDSYWADKSEDELVKLMRLKRQVSLDFTVPKPAVCSGAIVQHPVSDHGGTIVKDPSDPEMERWWEDSDRSGGGQDVHILEECMEATPMPCRDCPGRAGE